MTPPAVVGVAGRRELHHRGPYFLPQRASKCHVSSNRTLSRRHECPRACTRRSVPATPLSARTPRGTGQRRASGTSGHRPARSRHGVANDSVHACAHRSQPDRLHACTRRSVPCTRSRSHANACMNPQARAHAMHSVPGARVPRCVCSPGREGAMWCQRIVGQWRCANARRAAFTNRHGRVRARPSTRIRAHARAHAMHTAPPTVRWRVRTTLI